MIKCAHVKRLIVASFLLSDGPGAGPKQAPSLFPRLVHAQWPLQESITKRPIFVALLDRLYAPNGAWQSTITVHDDVAIIETQRRVESHFCCILPLPGREAKKDRLLLGEAGGKSPDIRTNHWPD